MTPPTHPEPTGVSRVRMVVPGMVDRADLRAVTAPVRDVPGVICLTVDLDLRLVEVEGSATLEEIRRAIEVAGYRVADLL